MITAILSIFRNQIALLDYGERDTLTGLYNRRTFEPTYFKLKNRIVKAHELGQPMLPSWIGVVDIDKFKNINDTYGHLFGDEVLLLVSRLILENFRGSDHVFRFGGEEFVIIVERTQTEGAKIAFERLRASIANYKFPQIGKITISVGFTEVLALDPPGAAFDRADAALYFAKNNGRNRVECHEALVAQGLLESSSGAKSGEIELF